MAIREPYRAGRSNVAALAMPDRSARRRLFDASRTGHGGGICRRFVCTLFARMSRPRGAIERRSTMRSLGIGTGALLVNPTRWAESAGPKMAAPARRTEAEHRVNVQNRRNTAWRSCCRKVNCLYTGHPSCYDPLVGSRRRAITSTACRGICRCHSAHRAGRTGTAANDRETCRNRQRGRADRIVPRSRVCIRTSG
jgi:hypothetical protein